jgi:DNA-binding GntR family transcriptional regulator
MLANARVGLLSDTSEADGYGVAVKIDYGGREFPYQQLARQIRERIASGEYPPGRMIPSINALVTETGLSVMAIRRAVALLERDGLVDIVPGRGTFVTEPQDRERLRRQD